MYSLILTRHSVLNSIPVQYSCINVCRNKGATCGDFIYSYCEYFFTAIYCNMMGTVWPTEQQFGIF